jgi:diaminopimelate epimerase
MRFVKMHGLRNDYVFVDGFEVAVSEPAALARRISDRHEGVGSDGLILLLPPEPGVDADVRMRMFNADGHEAEMCGNGVRCLAKLAFESGRARRNPMRVQTGRGVLTLVLHPDRAGRVDSVSVGMGPPVFEADRIPVRLGTLREVVDAPAGDVLPATEGGPAGDWRARSGVDGRITCVSMGNPHAVFFCRDAERVPLDRVGPLVERHPAFPSRTNVHFAHVLAEDAVRIRTWERGSGITRACGTGAAAVCAAGVATRRFGRRIRARTDGGDLELAWREDDGQIWMTGPAALAFTGEWPD